MGIFRGARGVKRERKQDKKKKMTVSYSVFGQKKVMAKFTAQALASKHAVVQDNARATADSFLTVFTGGLGCEKDRSQGFSQNSTSHEMLVHLKTRTHTHTELL